jgi:tetrahydromethanopterin S-methyltransferase subunit B
MSRGLLVMFASGDPWKVNATLQSGRPAQIADLGQAFHNAGQSTQEADKAFAEARRRFDAWIRDNGQHPITDSAEVQRTATALGLQASQLPKIAVDLENVAAALAQTQGTADAYINALEGRLQTLDDWIGQADAMIKRDENLVAQADDDDDICELEDDIDRLEQYIADCEREAVDDTKATLQQLERVRDDYADGLKRAKANLRTDGYHPAAIQALDGEDPKAQAAGDIPPSGFEAGELADLRHVTNQSRRGSDGQGARRAESPRRRRGHCLHQGPRLTGGASRVREPAPTEEKPRRRPQRSGQTARLQQRRPRGAARQRGRALPVRLHR